APGTEDPFVATVHRLVHGISWMWLGDSGRARGLLAEAARRGEAGGNPLAHILAPGGRGPRGGGRRGPAPAGGPPRETRAGGGAALGGGVPPRGRGPPGRPAGGLGQRCPGGGDRGGPRPPRRRPGGTRRSAAHRRGGEQNLPATRPCPGWAVSEKRPGRRSAR